MERKPEYHSAYRRERFEPENTVRKEAVAPDTPIIRNSEFVQPGEKLQTNDIGVKPIMVLFDTKNIDTDETTVSKCYCSECRKTFDLQNPLTLHPKSYGVNEGDIYASRKFQKDLNDIACPECGKTDEYVAVTLSDDGQSWQCPEFIQGVWAFEYRDKETGEPIRFDKNFITQQPTIYKKSGKIFSNITEYSEMTDLLNHDVRVSEKHASDEVDEKGKRLFDNKGTIATSVDVFQYPGYSKTGFNGKKTDVLDIHTTKEMHVRTRSTLTRQTQPQSYGEQYNELFISKLFALNFQSQHSRYIQKSYPSCHTEALHPYTQLTLEAKKQFLTDKLSRNKNIDPVYTDWSTNGLFISEHHPGSSEATEQTNETKNMMYMTMLIRYPAAFEYACERTNNDLQNEYYSKQRKHKENPEKYKEPVEPKDMPASVKARYFRKNMFFVAEQLTTCDDKVLNAIHHSKDLAEMKKQLQFFVFGDQEGTKKKPISDTLIPDKIKDIKTDKDGKVSHAYQATNDIISMFNQNPIGTANTAYTCHKIGIHDTTVATEVMKYAMNESPKYGEQVRIRGERVTVNPKYKPHINAQTIRPIMTSSELHFLRSYIKNFSGEKGKTDEYNTIDGQRYVAKNILMNEDNQQVYKDSVAMYRTISSQKNIIVNADRDSSDMGAIRHEMDKSQLKEYLINQTNNPVGSAMQNAYRDFAEKGEDWSKDNIDAMVREIKHDEIFDQIKHYYEKYGEKILDQPDVVKALAHFDTEHEDPKAAKEAKLKAIQEYTPTDERKLYISTTDNKPLFAKRPLVASSGHYAQHGLHDELSTLSKKVSSNQHNVKIKYDAREKQLEGSYPSSPDTPDIQYSFHLMKDKYDFIRTATDLSNCVGGGHYFANASLDNHDARTYVLYMTDEKAKRIACIEVDQEKERDPNDATKNITRYYIKQFESKHDSSLPDQYAYAAVEWMNDHNMKSKSGYTEINTFCQEDSQTGKLVVKEEIQNKYFHGANADYHVQEVDDVDNVMRAASEMEQIRERRNAAAKAMYPDGLPEAPEDLQIIFDTEIADPEAPPEEPDDKNSTDKDRAKTIDNDINLDETGHNGHNGTGGHNGLGS